MFTLCSFLYALRFISPQRTQRDTEKIYKLLPDAGGITGLQNNNEKGDFSDPEGGRRKLTWIWFSFTGNILQRCRNNAAWPVCFLPQRTQRGTEKNKYLPIVNC